MALDDDWKPFHVRLGEPEQGPFPDFSGHLHQPVEDWLNRAISNVSREEQVEILLRLRIPPEFGTQHPVLLAVQRLRPAMFMSVVDAVLAVCAAKDRARLFTEQVRADLVKRQPTMPIQDYMMAMATIPPSPEGWRNAPAQLRELLGWGGSMWTVSNDGGSLVRRVDPTVEAAVADATKDPSTASSHHLHEAYVKAFGTKPEPGTSYGESIRAVESAGWPHVTPQNPRQTLGTMIADLRQTPEKWNVSIPSDNGIERVRSMMELLWQGQIDRHGDVNLKQVTPEAAEAAVFLASTLVQWFNSGGIRRAKSSD